MHPGVCATADREILQDCLALAQSLERFFDPTRCHCYFGLEVIGDLSVAPLYVYFGHHRRRSAHAQVSHVFVRCVEHPPEPGPPTDETCVSLGQVTHQEMEYLTVWAIAKEFLLTRRCTRLDVTSLSSRHDPVFGCSAWVCAQVDPVQIWLAPAAAPRPRAQVDPRLRALDDSDGRGTVRHAAGARHSGGGLQVVRPPTADVASVAGVWFEVADFGEDSDTESARDSDEEPDPPPLAGGPRQRERRPLAESGHADQGGAAEEADDVANRRALRGEDWHGFSIARIYRSAMCVGVGATCGRHRDVGGGSQTACKKSIMFGANLTESECVLRMKQWLLMGAAIPEDATDGRRRHVAVNARSVPLWDTALIEAGPQ